MLVLGILGVPSVGPAAMQRPHCSAHGSAVMDQQMHSRSTHQAPASTDPASWESSSGHECPHCPATECARVAPCASASTAVILEASLAVSDLATARVRVRRVQVHPYSSIQQPPTPPPQLIS